MWRFHDFSIKQNLREINLRHSKSAKSAMLTHLEDLNLDFFYELLHSLKIEVLELLAPLNLISRKV